MTSFLGVPVASRGLVTGVLHVTTRERRTFTPSEVSLLQLAAGRVASSLERTRLYAEREQTGTVLQRAIVPGKLPEVPGLDLDGLYVPYAPGEDVGGDFYDVFPTTDGAYLLAIGDVSGKGAAAAAVMGFVRHSLRAIARFVHGPAEHRARAEPRARWRTRRRPASGSAPWWSRGSSPTRGMRA